MCAKRADEDQNKPKNPNLYSKRDTGYDSDDERVQNM